MSPDRGAGLPQPAGPGPLTGVRVVELAHPHCAFAGKLLADAGADVILVEPPGGSAQRRHGPFVDRKQVAAAFLGDEELSLAFWADNTSKRSVVVDLASGPDRRFFRRLIAGADVFLEAEEPGALADLGLDHPDLTGRPLSGADQGRTKPGPPPVNEDLIQVSITPLGRVWRHPVAERHRQAAMTDLTVLARGGPLWMCGYDDHGLAPMRGRGDQAIRTACHHAVMAALTALLARDANGGQFVDVSMVAAANVTTEAGTYGWFAARQIPFRQTGRHARAGLTEPTQMRCADGRWLNTGVGLRSGAEFAAVADYIIELGLVDEAGPELMAALDRGAEEDRITTADIDADPELRAVFKAGRRAMGVIAAHLSAHEAFVGLQGRGVGCGVVWSPDEVLDDPHLIDRGFPTEVYQPQLDRTVIYPGPPIRFGATPMAIRSPAPRLGQHSDQVRREVR